MSGWRVALWRVLWPAVRRWALDRALRVPEALVERLSADTGVEASVVRRICQAAAWAALVSLEGLGRRAAGEEGG